MANPQVNAITALVPAKDFEKSRNFYLKPGFEQTWREGDNACGLRMDDHNIILQNFYVQEHSENFMPQLVVREACAWWERIEKLGLKQKYQLSAASPPAMQPWGLLVFYLADPAGVLWHIGEAPKT